MSSKTRQSGLGFTLSYRLSSYARNKFPDIVNRKEREHAGECDLVHLFFGRAAKGFYIEVGANELKRSSQTWMLEQAGWAHKNAPWGEGRGGGGVCLS